MATRVTKTGSTGVEFQDAPQPLQIEDLDADLDEIFSNIDSSNIAPGGLDTTVIDDGAITTIKLAPGATFTQYLEDATDNVTVTTSDTVIATQAITSTRGIVRLVGLHSAALVPGTGGLERITLKLKRDGSTVAEQACIGGINGGHSFAKGSYTGTGTGFTVTVPFTPNGVLIWTNSTSNEAKVGLLTGDAPTIFYGLLRDANDNVGTLDMSGLFPGGGIVSGGFAVGDNLSFNESGKQYRWFAWGDLSTTSVSFFGMITYVDQPGIGTFTYTLTAVQGVSGAYTDDDNHNKLSIEEIV
jgi:hypothetical protein